MSELRLARLAGTTAKEGTPEEGMAAAINGVGFHHEACESMSFRDAYKWLRRQLHDGHPTILCTSNWGHYITAIGMIGSKVVVFDPDPAVAQDNGVFVYSRARLRKLWYHNIERSYFAMAVKRPGT